MAKQVHLHFYTNNEDRFFIEVCNGKPIFDIKTKITSVHFDDGSNTLWGIKSIFPKEEGVVYFREKDPAQPLPDVADFNAKFSIAAKKPKSANSLTKKE